MKNLNSNWPCFDRIEAKKISKILLSNKVNYWTGNEGRLFEKEFSKFANAKYSIVVSNGTDALEIALKSIEIKKNDEVIVTPRSFIASVSSVIRCGAKPIFADVEANSGNISAETISKVISKKTKAIVCVHLAGFPCDMVKIKKLANKYSVKIIEDCSQAHGAKINNKSVGSFGDISTWSFCQDKIISTGGEGGMITTNSKKLWSKSWSLRDHGKDYNTVFNNNSKNYRWLHLTFGGNSRLTEMQSAIGRLQLKKMNLWNKKRAQNASKILSVLKKFNKLITIPLIPNNFKHAWYRCTVHVNDKYLKKGWSRNLIIDELRKLGIKVFVGSCPEIYLEKAFKNKIYKPKKRLTNAKKLGENTLAFLTHPTITLNEINYTTKCINTILNKAKKQIKL